MFLEQIERRLDEKKRAAAQHLAEQATDKVAGAKTVGVKVPPELYGRLDALRRKHGFKSIKAALLYAAAVGVEVVG